MPSLKPYKESFWHIVHEQYYSKHIPQSSVVHIIDWEFHFLDSHIYSFYISGKEEKFLLNLVQFPSLMRE